MGIKTNSIDKIVSCFQVSYEELCSDSLLQTGTSARQTDTAAIMQALLQGQTENNIHTFLQGEAENNIHTLLQGEAGNNMEQENNRCIVM